MHASAHSDYNFRECREALAEFDQALIQHAAMVMTSGDENAIHAAAEQGGDMARVIFWVGELVKADRITSQAQALLRIKHIEGIRRERRTLKHRLFQGANAALGSVAGLWHTAILFKTQP